MNDYKTQPKKEYRDVMDYKNDNIRRAMDDKQEAIKISSAGRDAVLITTTFYNKIMTEDEIKEKIIKWRDWLYKEVYTMSDEKYRELNNPF